MNPGRKKTLLAGIAIALISFAGLKYLTAPTRPEPVFQGKSLTRWLKQLDDGEAFGISSSGIPPFSPEQAEAAAAIYAIGRPALPWLMLDIHTTPDPNSRHFRFQKRINSLIERITGRPNFFWSEVTEEDRIRWRAAQGLAALGPLAKPAVPELQRLLMTNFFHSSIKEAAYALATIGPEGIDALTNAVRPQSEWSGMCAIWALGQHPNAGRTVIPFLINATSSPSEGTSCGALQVLGLLHTDPEHVVPVLTNSLMSSNQSVSDSAAFALGHFGAQAAVAIPLLQSLTNNPKARSGTLDALHKIQSADTQPEGK